jgi:hypothetical protein
MTVLPDIIREPVIIAAKQNPLSSSQLFVDSNCSRPSSAEARQHTDLQAVSNIASEPQKLFPFLILNDKKRSTGYRSSDPDGRFQIRTSPLATSVMYKWPNLSRHESGEGSTNSKLNFQSRSQSHFQKFLSRLPHPSRPDSMYKMETSWETSDGHFHNQQRTLSMKRNQNIRENTIWAIGPYGDIKERESFK